MMLLLKPGIDERRLKAYRAGAQYRFGAPPVCTARWDDDSWSRWVTFTEPDRYGSLCEHRHRPYRAVFGMPCTGPRVCSACGTYFYDDGTSESIGQRAARLARRP
jgi:hypothetical protein